MILAVREKSQNSHGLIVLPQTKWTTSKSVFVLAAGKRKLKSGNDVENNMYAGARGLAHQADRGIEAKAWDNLQFEIDGEITLYPDKLPEGVEVTPAVSFFNINDSMPKQVVTVKKGTAMQILFEDDVKAELLNGESPND